MTRGTVGRVNVDENATVYGSTQGQIAAPPQLVWETLTCFQDWPSWNPDVKSMEASGPALPGTSFRWRTGSTTVTSTVREVDAPRVIGWTGKALGIRAAHVWRIEPSDGGTYVHTEESFEGPLARVFRGRLRSVVSDALESGLRHLKAEAERRAQPSHAADWRGRDQ
jgi:hypothetical protein